MHWLDKLCAEYGVTKYAISKKSGISQPLLSKTISNNTALDKMEFGKVVQIAKGIGISLDELYAKVEQLNASDD